MSAFSNLAKETNTILLPSNTGDISGMVSQVCRHVWVNSQSTSSSRLSIIKYDIFFFPPGQAMTIYSTLAKTSTKVSAQEVEEKSEEDVNQSVQPQ